MKHKRQSKINISYIKQKFLRIVMGAMGALMLLSAPNAFAFPTSGTCAMLATPPVPVGAPIPHNNTYNVLAMITFTSATTGTIDAFTAGVTYTGEIDGIAGFAGYTGLGLGLPLAITSPGVFNSPNSKTLEFTKHGDSQPTTMNAFSVNGDRTILIQGVSDPFSGVCQF